MCSLFPSSNYRAQRGEGEKEWTPCSAITWVEQEDAIQHQAEYLRRSFTFLFSRGESIGSEKKFFSTDLGSGLGGP